MFYCNVLKNIKKTEGMGEEEEGRLKNKTFSSDFMKISSLCDDWEAQVTTAL